MGISSRSHKDVAAAMHRHSARSAAPTKEENRAISRGRAGSARPPISSGKGGVLFLENAEDDPDFNLLRTLHILIEFQGPLM
jgi:hypothetical protein